MRRWVMLFVAASLALAACGPSKPASLPPTPLPQSPPSGTPSPPGPPPSWVTIAAPPIAGRISEGVVWTGKEMIVWGGVSAGAQVADGAAYDPAADSWRKLAPAPQGVMGGGGSAATWTGHLAGVWA